MQYALISALFAAGVISKPLHDNHAQFHKRQEVVNVATDYAYETAVVTVTYGQEPSSTAAPVTTTVAPPVTYAAPSTTPSSTYVAPTSSAAAPSSTQASYAAAPSASSASSGNAFLDAHNNYRSMHGATMMTWNESLAQTAQSYGCANGDKQAGSNWAGGSSMSEADAVKMWYDEEQAYATATNNYSIDPPSGYSGPETGHFSQLIWDASTTVGCAMVNSCGTYTNQVTCLYYPAGNVAMAGQQSYVQNVFAPTQAGQ